MCIKRAAGWESAHGISVLLEQGHMRCAALNFSSRDTRRRLLSRLMAAFSRALSAGCSHLASENTYLMILIQSSLAIHGRPRTVPAVGWVCVKLSLRHQLQAEGFCTKRVLRLGKAGSQCVSLPCVLRRSNALSVAYTPGPRHFPLAR